MISKSLSHSRIASSKRHRRHEVTELEKKNKTIFGRLGVTHKPGFSRVNKVLPRNNNNFVKKENSNEVSMSNTSKFPRGQQQRMLSSGLYDSQVLMSAENSFSP